MDYRLTRNPLLQTVIYKRFHHVANGLGFDPVEKGMIPSELCTYLRQEIESIPDQDEQAKQLIHKSVNNGEVIAIEMLEDGTNSLLVRSPIHTHFADLRMTYQSGTWQFTGVASIHTMPLYKKPIFKKLTAAVACLVLLFGGFVIGSFAPKQIDIQQYAKDHGYVVMTISEQQKLLSDSTDLNKGSSNTLTASRGTTLNSTAASTISFTLQDGMGTQDLTDFLVAHHLVQDGVAFNQKLIDQRIDRTLQLGTYTFQTNMTEDQIVDVIKQGPHAQS